MFPAAAVKIFGMVNGGQILSIMMFAQPMSSLASYGFVAANVDYPTVFYIGAALTVVNMITLYFFDDSELNKDLD